MPAQVIRLFNTDRSPSIIDEIAPLVEAGFAIHWLHPRQKRPIGKDWSTAPVATRADLQRSYAADNNVGVRLGEFSRAAGLYVHVLDLDVRVDDLADEVWSALRDLFPDVDFDALPMVRSGSGGASCHLYFCSTRPFYSKKLATSPGKHRGDDGKWHRDWEIELYGTGKQVVLPPSIHPITGNPYRWERPFDFDMLDLGLTPEIPAAAIDAIGAATDETYAFEERPPLDFKPGQLERELDLIEISDLDYDDWVRVGQALHHQFGGSQEGFDLWLEHTKRSTKFTGDAQIREMRRIKWPSFGRYRGKPVTMATIRTWAMEARAAALRDAFDEEDDEGVDITDAEDLFGGDEVAADSQAPAATADQFDDDTPATTTKPSLDWISLLDINEEGGLRPNLHNVRLIVSNDPRIAGVPQFNEFTQETVQRTLPGIKRARREKQAKAVLQLKGDTWLVSDPINGDLWSDDRDHAVRAIIEAPKTQGGYGLKVADRDLKAAIDIAARDNRFHPVREYLGRLVWDGKPRVDTLFIDYLNTADDSYHRSVARIMMVAAVTRVHEPGHKFDQLSSSRVRRANERAPSSGVWPSPGFPNWTANSTIRSRWSSRCRAPGFWRFRSFQASLGPMFERLRRS